MGFNDMWQRFTSFTIQTRRVLQVTRRPNKEEYKAILKITALGVAAIGMLGFILQIIKQVLFT